MCIRKRSGINEPFHALCCHFDSAAGASGPAADRALAVLHMGRHRASGQPALGCIVPGLEGLLHQGVEEEELAIHCAKGWDGSLPTGLPTGLQLA